MTIAELKEPGAIKPPVFDIELRILAWSSPEEDGGKGSKGGKGKSKGKAKGKSTGNTESQKQRVKCTMWAADDTHNEEISIEWKRREAPPHSLRGTRVLFKLVKPRTTAETGISLAIDQSSSWSLLLERTDEAANSHRPSTTTTWHVTQAWQESHRSLVKVLMFVSQTPVVKTTRNGDDYLHVAGTDKASHPFSLNAWNIQQDDGLIESGKWYVVHGLRVQNDKYNASEGWMEIAWDRQYSAFEDVRASVCVLYSSS